MISIYQGRSVNDVWQQAFADLVKQASEGYENGSRDGAVVGEVLNAAFCVEDPTRNIVTSKYRKLPMRYAVGELLWYLSGSNKTADIAQFATKWNEISDDGVHANSAYGYRIGKKFGFDQWAYVVDLLRKDPDSRQAVIHIKDADNAKTKDLPCTVYLQFLIREGKLHMMAHMRSNDIWMGVPYDMFSFCAMQMLMAMQLGVQVGSYTHYAGSLHLYKRDYETAKHNMEELNPYGNTQRREAH